MSAALAAAIEADRDALIAAASRRHEGDPFWAARFGERGLFHARQDAGFHIVYLAEALRTESPASLGRYAHWLRDTLVPRGMCTLHVTRSLAALGDAIDERGLDPHGIARRFLSDASAAIAHRDGAAGELARLGLADRLGALAAGPPASAHPTLGSDLACVASYAEDALASSRPELLVAHVVFLARFHQQRGASLAPLHGAIAALNEAVAELPEPARGAAVAVAAMASRALPP